MKIVDVDPDNLNWPACCCRCGARDYQMHEHAERVVASPLLGLQSVMNDRIVTLMVPVCKRCSGAHLLWYGLATACGLVLGIAAKISNGLSSPFFFSLLTGVFVCASIGMRQRPLRILHVDDDNGTMRLKVYNDMVGAQLRRTAPGQPTPNRS